MSGSLIENDCSPGVRGGARLSPVYSLKMTGLFIENDRSLGLKKIARALVF
jgi:hypothetical protein